MPVSLKEFLRHGGNGQYVLVRRNGAVYGYREGISIKSLFPAHTGLRANFTEQLDRIIADNTKMLLNALTPPDSVPGVTEADLRDVSDAKEEALRQWDARLAVILEEYETHPQRLGALRSATEERLLRAFAGLINQLRQQDLGIERYIWRSRDDAWVRDIHAEYDDQVFSWNAPPEGGHPGQAFNCRCYAEPVVPGPQGDVVLADFAPTADGFPGSGATVRRLANGLLARSPAGLAAYAALEASNQLQAFTQAANDRRIRDAAAAMGADLGTVEGVLAALAYAQAKELAENGFLSDAPERGERARVIAEAIGLYEMAQPGMFTLPGENGLAAATLARRLAAEALAALDAGRLVPDDGALSQGWVEVFPELTGDERRLGQLPGFTAERIDQWLETYPAEALGLPTHTGTAPPRDPTGTIISTPIPDEAGPNIVEARPGEPTRPSPNDDEATRRGIQRENESAQLLAEKDYDVLQNPVVVGPKKPDYLINGEVYDHYAPSTDLPRKIWREVQRKVERGQTNNVVINLHDSAVKEEALRRQFEEWPIQGLREVIIIRRDSTIGRF